MSNSCFHTFLRVPEHFLITVHRIRSVLTMKIYVDPYDSDLLYYFKYKVTFLVLLYFIKKTEKEVSFKHYCILSIKKCVVNELNIIYR